jgi:gliding motility-associated-like protein
VKYSGKRTIKFNSMRWSNFSFITIFALMALQSLGQKPDIEYINRHIGPMGMQVTIVGSGFAPEPEANRVFFGAAPTRVLSATETILTVRVPAGSTYAPIEVTNLRTGLSARSRLPFMLSFHGGDQANLSFRDPVSIPAESGLNDLVTCDFDLDGKVDIATANVNSTRISILSNQSDVTSVDFTSAYPNAYPLNSQSIYIQAGDLNGDGKPELVVSRYGVPAQRVFVLVNRSTPGNISFEPPVHILVDGDKVRQVAIADLDLDGKNDILATNTDNKKVTILKNKSTATEILMERLPSYEITDPALGSERNTFGLAVADLNGDKFPEMVINGFTQQNVFIVPNVSSPGTIRFGAVKELESVGNLVNVAIGDVNHDGRPDIIATKLLQNNIALFLNRTDISSTSGTNLDFTPEIEIGVANEPYGLDLGDLDGDGRLDIVVSSQDDDQSRRLSVLVNKSSDTAVAFELLSLAAPSASKFLRVGDINGDAKPDITLAGFESNQIIVLGNSTCVVPVIYADSNIKACVGDEIVLRATPSPGLIYSWVQTNSGLSSTIDNQTPVLKLTPPEGLHTIVLTVSEPTGNCEFAADPITLDIQSGDNIEMKPSIVSPGRICAGAPVNITLETSKLTIGAEYRWIAPDGTQTITESMQISAASLADAGEYIVIAEKGYCKSVPDTLLLEVVKPPNLYIKSDQPQQFCDGYSALLETIDDPLLSYQWTRDGADIQNATSAAFSATTGGEYTVKGLYFETCAVESPVFRVATLTPPLASFDMPETGCVGSVVHFRNTSTADPSAQVAYLWTNDNIGVTDVESPTHAYDAAGQYQVTLRLSYRDERCASTNTKIIDIANVPAVTIGYEGEPVICSGEELILTANGTFNTYTWNDNSTGSSIVARETGTYEVTVTNENGCEGKASVDVLVHPVPTVSITPANPSVAAGETIQLTASGANTYVWTDVEGIQDLYVAEPLVSPVVTSTYSVEGTDENNCTGTAQVTVVVAEADILVDEQVLLTPNGDGKNERFTVEGIEYHPEYQVSIFNRNGVKVFEKSNYYGNEWNGTYNGSELSNGVYYYVISNAGEKVKSGNITVLK